MDRCFQVNHKLSYRDFLLLSAKLVENNQLDIFFEDFDKAVEMLEKKRNEEIASWVKSGRLSAQTVDSYKDENPLQIEKIYGTLVETRDQYPDIVKLFKLSLLITPSTANVERGFSVLTLLHTKQRNSPSLASLEKLMRIVLQGPEKLNDETYETLVDKFRDSTSRRIDL